MKHSIEDNVKLVHTHRSLIKVVTLRSSAYISTKHKIPPPSYIKAKELTKCVNNKERDPTEHQVNLPLPRIGLSSL